MYIYEIPMKVITPLMIGKTIIENEEIIRERDRNNVLRDNHYIKKIYLAELNTNPFKGILRWWFRKLISSFNDEANLFGSTEKGSPFKLRLIPTNYNKSIWNENLHSTNNFGTYEFSRGKGRYDGLAYFGRYIYTKQRPNERNDYIGKIQTHEYITPNSEFKIIISSYSEEILNKVLILLWLTLQFGGIGYRSRRGFGNLITTLDPIELEINNRIFVFTNTYRNIQEYQFIVNNNLNIIINYFNANHSELNRATILYSSNNLEDTWDRAINFAGTSMQIFRALKDPDHTNIHNFRTLRTIERAIFGLPIQFGNIIVNHYDIINGQYEGQRFASPIIVSFTLINNQYLTQYMVLPFNFNKLNIYAELNENYRQLVINNITNEFINFLLNPDSKNIAGHLNCEINTFKYTKLI